MVTQDHAQKWHEALNRHNHIGKDWKHWMYEAKTASTEVGRLILLFGMARKGELAKIHRQCSRCEPEPIPENYLTCCLGVKCAECPELKALDAMEVSEPEAIDEAKAWTCVAHIISKGGDPAGEGYVLTVDDQMFWNRIYESMSQSG